MMNKRIVYTSLMSLLILFGVYFVVADLDTTNTNIITSGDGYGISNTTKGGVIETFNITITHDATGLNITEVNITIPNNYTFLGIVNNQGLIEGNYTNSTGFWINKNWTWQSVNGGGNANWGCANTTGVTLGNTHISCRNLSVLAALGAHNTTLIMRINLTAQSSAEKSPVFNITTTTTDKSTNSTLKTMLIDGLAPRLIQLNVSDGNITLANGTGIAGSNRALNLTYIVPAIGPALRYGTLTVRATLVDTNTQNVWLYYNTSNIQNASIAAGTRKAMTSTDPGTTRMYTATFSSSELINENLTTFVLFTNDTLNNNFNYNETGLTPFTFNVSSSEPVYVSNVNVSATLGSTTYTVADLISGTNYLPTSSFHTFRIVVSGDLAANITLVYNTTGALTIGTNGYIANYDYRSLVNHNLTGSVQATGATDKVQFNVSLPFAGNDTKTIRFAVIMNSTKGGLVIGGPYTYKVDETSPSEPALTVPTTRSITTADSIIYSCSSTDTGSGISSYSWILTKPDGSTVTKSGASATFSGTDVNRLGTHTVQCTATDAVGYSTSHTSTTSENFVVSASTSSGTSGGGGGSATTTTPAFDIDLKAQNTATVEGSQGTIKSFTFDGATKHTITFKSVSTDKVTIVIASTPVEVELSVKETKEVDMNADGTNDLKATLNKITNGKADVTIEKIVAGAEKVIAEDKAAAEAAAQEEVGAAEPAAKAASLTWLWIVIIVVVLLVIGYFVFGKKK